MHALKKLVIALFLVVAAAFAVFPQVSYADELQPGGG